MTSPPEFKPQAVVSSCDLCQRPGGNLLWSDGNWRVVRVEDAAFPAFYRVICNHHVGEFSELLAPERQHCMNLVCAIERVLIARLAPTKVNLAALGNVVPHLHWHVVARFAWDSHFPQPIWGAAQRSVEGSAQSWLGMCLSDLDDAVVEAVAGA